MYIMIVPEHFFTTVLYYCTSMIQYEVGALISYIGTLNGLC